MVGRLRQRLAPIAVALALATSLAHAAAPAGEKAAPAPAPAAPAAPGPGTYPRDTSNAAYKYYVCVPKTWSAEKPAGIHLYFHGQGGQGSAPDFGLWGKHFLEPFNLIGINMQYTDGDNGRDTSGKADAAVEAIRKTAAEFKIVLGRGAVGSFSGGGLPHAKLFAKFTKEAPGGPSPCPFNHSALYGSNYWSSPASEPPMSWFIGVGTGEWNMGQPTLGDSQTRRAEQLFGAALKGGCPDGHFKVIKDKGHTIADADVQASAAQFRRSDLAFAPFLYEPDYAGSPLLPIVRRANTLALGQAAAQLKRALADPKADADARSRAEALEALLDARVEAVLALARELAETDPVLCAYYGNLFTRQLTGHPHAKDLKTVLAEARKQPAFATAPGAFRQFCTNFKNLLSGPHLKPGADRFLEGVKSGAGEKSLAGTMAAELLTLRDGPQP